MDKRKSEPHKDLGEVVSAAVSCNDKNDPGQRKAWHVLKDHKGTTVATAQWER